MKPKHWFVFILLGAIWSSSFMWIKIAVQEIGPITLVAFRVLFGLLFGVAVILLQRAQLSRSLNEWSPLLILGVTNVAVPFFLISWGEQTIDSAVAAILDATVPLFTILIAHYLLHDDKMTVPKVLGLLMGFAGVVILMSKDIGDSLGSVFGQLAVVLACAFYAGSAVYARKTTEATSGIMRSVGPLVSATAVMWLATFLVESPVEIPQLGITWIALLFLGVVGSGVAFILLYYLIHEIGPTRTSMVTYLFPLGGVILGVAFLNEQLSWQLLVGAVLIILSLVVANMRPQKREQKMEEQVATDSRRASGL
ncbi:MAG: DMT family transporter [Chloroflexi bacterium]|nr:MAG: DMT family transporter [Chloroflexota bacterium]